MNINKTRSIRPERSTLWFIAAVWLSIFLAGQSFAGDLSRSKGHEALVTNDSCAATLSADLLLHVPVLLFNTQRFQADFRLIPETLEIQLTGGDAASMNGCEPSLLTPDLRLHIPELTYSGVSYVADFQYSHDLSLALTGVGLRATSTHYQLSTFSSFQEGCVSPCLCPVSIALPLSGTFTLIPMNPEPSFQRFSIDEISWTVTGPDGNVRHTITGYGTYLIGSESGTTAQLSLELGIDNGDLVLFDSGPVPVGSQFPAITISLDRGSSCYNIFLKIDAAPVFEKL